MITVVVAALLSGQALPAAPVPYSSLGRRPAPSAPRSASDRPDNPSPGMAPEAWSARVRGNYQAAQSRRGALDGAWTVKNDQGVELLVLQLSDQPGAPVEGAWRAAAGRAEGSGLLDGERTDEGARLRIEQRGAPAVLTLRPSGEEWVGELAADGTSTPVRLTRAPAAG